MAIFDLIYKDLNKTGDPQIPDIRYETWDSTVGILLPESEEQIKYIPITVNYDLSDIPAGTNIDQPILPEPARQSYQLQYWDLFLEREGVYELYRPGMRATPAGQNVEATALWNDPPIDFSLSYFALPECSNQDYIFNGWRRYIDGEPENLYPIGYTFMCNTTDYSFKPEFTPKTRKIIFEMGEDVTPDSDPGPSDYEYQENVQFTLKDAFDSSNKTWKNNDTFTLVRKDSVFPSRDDLTNEIVVVEGVYNGQWYYYVGNTKVYVTEDTVLSFEEGIQTFYACYSTNDSFDIQLDAIPLPEGIDGNIVNYKWKIEPESFSYTSQIFNSREVQIYQLPPMELYPIIYTDYGSRKSSLSLKFHNGLNVSIDNISKIGILVEKKVGEDTYSPIVYDGHIQCIYPYTAEQAAAQAENGIISSDPMGIYETYIENFGFSGLAIKDISADEIVQDYTFAYMTPSLDITTAPPQNITLSGDDPHIIAVAYWSYNLYFYDGDTQVAAQTYDYYNNVLIDSGIEIIKIKEAYALGLESSLICNFKNQDGSNFVFPLTQEKFKCWRDRYTNQEYYENRSYFKNYRYSDVIMEPVYNLYSASFTLPNAIAFGGELLGWRDSDGVLQPVGKKYTTNSLLVFTAEWDYINYRIYDSNYIGFTLWDNDNTLLFDSIEEGIYRVSDSSRYNENLLPNFTDKTQVAPGGDGTYYFDSQYTNRQISISIAYDYLTEAKRKKLLNILARKKPYWLVFDEYPYKKYLVKAQSIPTLKWVPFNNDKDNAKRIYKGEGTLNFVCYNPFALSRFKFIEQFENDFLNRRIISIKLVQNKTYDHVYNLAQNGKLLIKNYLSVMNLGDQGLEYIPISDEDIYYKTEEQIKNEVYYYWQYGNIDEWWPYAVELAHMSKRYDTFIDKNVNLYNPGDIETDFILKISKSGGTTAASDMYTIKLGNEVKMRLDLGGIAGIIIIDTKQHCIYQKSDNTIIYLNDKILEGDFFKIPCIIDPAGIKLSVTPFQPNAYNAATIEYNYLYY